MSYLNCKALLTYLLQGVRTGHPVYTVTSRLHARRLNYLTDHEQRNDVSLRLLASWLLSSLVALAPFNPIVTNTLLRYIDCVKEGWNAIFLGYKSVYI